MIYDEADHEYILLTNALGHGLVKTRRKARTHAKRAATKRTAGFMRCATCKRERRAHVWFRGLLWCPAKDYRATDDSTPIYLLTWRDFVL